MGQRRVVKSWGIWEIRASWRNGPKGTSRRADWPSSCAPPKVDEVCSETMTWCNSPFFHIVHAPTPPPLPFHHLVDAPAGQSHRRRAARLTACPPGIACSAVPGASRENEKKDLLSIAPSSSHNTVIPYPYAAEPEARRLLDHHHPPVREIARYIVAHCTSSWEACTSQRQVG